MFRWEHKKWLHNCTTWMIQTLNFTKLSTDWRAWCFNNNQVSCYAYLNGPACISACQLSGTVIHRERRRELRSPYLLQWKTTTKPKEPEENLLVLFPQVIPRSLAHGQTCHETQQLRCSASWRPLTRYHSHILRARCWKTLIIQEQAIVNKCKIFKIICIYLF